MSLENDMAAKVLGKILAEGMNLADCELENQIDSAALSALKEIKNAVLLNTNSDKKVENVEKILKEYEW